MKISDSTVNAVIANSVTYAISVFVEVEGEEFDIEVECKCTITEYNEMGYFDEECTVFDCDEIGLTDEDKEAIKEIALRAAWAEYNDPNSFVNKE